MARIGKSRGLSHLSALDPKPEIIRYEKETPGEMIHIDIKKLGRIEGIGHRITPSGRLQAIACRAMGDRTGQSTPRSRKEGGKGWRVMTDNRVSFRSHRHAKALRMLAIKHKRTKPYTPQDQRQSRAVRSDIPARMGLAKPCAQSDQRPVRPTPRCPRTLPEALQPPPPPLRTQRQNPNLEDSKQQPVET